MIQYNYFIINLKSIAVLRDFLVKMLLHIWFQQWVCACVGLPVMTFMTYLYIIPHWRNNLIVTAGVAYYLNTSGLNYSENKNSELNVSIFIQTDNITLCTCEELIKTYPCKKMSSMYCHYIKVQKHLSPLNTEGTLL